MQAQLEHSEALVRQLRAELANAHFANSSSTTPSTSASNSPPETDKASGSNTDFDMPTAMLNIMRATLDSLTLPKPLHEEDLAEVGIADKVSRPPLLVRRPQFNTSPSLRTSRCLRTQEGTHTGSSGRALASGS